MTGRLTGDGWGRQTVVVALVASTLVVTMIAIAMARVASADDADAAHDHSDHAHHVSVLDHDGRFTGPGEWPPRHKGATDFSAVEITNGQGNGREIAAMQAATNNRSVGQALGQRYGAASVAPIDAERNAQRVTFFSHEKNQTVTATVVDGDVVEVTETPAGVGQPPISPAEGRDAVALARGWWEAENNGRIGELEGFAIRAFQADGSLYPVRMAYVSFHVHVDAAPELLALVDLTNNTVTEGWSEQ